MAFMIEQLREQAEANVVALRAMTAAQRQIRPTLTFRREYNKLRTFVLEQKPELAQLMPPVVDEDSEKPFDDSMQQLFEPLPEHTNYLELHSYYERIVALLRK